MHKMNKKTEWSRLLLKVLVSTAGVAAILLLCMGIVNWLWVLGHEPEPWQKMHSFLRGMAISSLVVGAQLGVLFITASVLSIIRGRHNMLAGVLAGIVLFLLDVVTIHMGFLQHSRATITIVLVGLPLLVSGLQFCPCKKNGKASNQALEAIAPQGGSQPQR